MDALTKKDIAVDIAVYAELTYFEASKAIEIFLEIIKEALEKGEDVTLSGFGKWSVREKRARRACNPRTGREIFIKPRRVAAFSLSNILRAKLEGKK